MFAAEFEPAQLPRRRSPRAMVGLEAAVNSRGGLARALCRVVDVSMHGARLQTYSALSRGSTILLTLPRVGRVAADVMWASDFAAGCQFRRPLAEADVSALASAAA